MPNHRMADAPAAQVELMSPSGCRPAGVGEPGGPPAAPALGALVARPRIALAALAALVLGGCKEPAPRFEAPVASGVVAVPLRDTQRFDATLSQDGMLAALRGHAGDRFTVRPVGADAAIIVAHVPRAEFSARLLGRSIAALDALGDGYALVLGSGFVSVFNPVEPLGLLQLEGRVVSEPAPHGYTRILGVRAGVINVVARADYHPGLFEAAMQVGPGVVQAGRLDILQQERELPAYIRAFAVTCADRFLAGVAQVPMHLYDVGERLLAYFHANGLRCDEVANLSGDREALLAIASADGASVAYFGNPTLPKAALLAFREVAR